MRHNLLSLLRRCLLTVIALLTTITVMAGEPDTYNYRQGKEAYSNGDYEKAKQWFEKDLQANPKSGYVQYWLGCIAIQQDEVEKALELLTTAEKNLPKNENDTRAMCCTLRASLYLDNGMNEPGLTALKAAQKYKPQKKVLYTILSLYENGDFTDEATALLDQMIKDDPSDPTPYSRLAGIKLGAEEYTGAIKFYTKAMELDDSQGDVLAMRALAHLKNGDAQEAVDDMFRAIDLDETDYSLRVMSAIADDEKALPLLIAELEKRSVGATDSRWPYYLAQVYQNSGAPAKNVLKYMKQALAIEKGTNLYIDIAKLYADCGLSDKALATLDEAIAFDKKENEGENLAELYNEKSNVYFDKSDLAEGIACLDKAIEEQENGDLYDARGLFKAWNGNDEEAIADLNKAEELEGISSSGLFYRGWLYRKQGNTTLAEASLRKAIEADSVGTPINFTFVSQHFLGLDDRAKDNAALCLADTLLGARRFYHVAQLYSLLGDRTMAIHRLQQCLDTPDDVYTDFRKLSMLRSNPFTRELMSAPELQSSIAATEQRIKDKQRELEE